MGRRWVFAAWLAATAGCAVGGWFFGRGEFAAKNSHEKETRSTRSRRAESVFAVDSPKGQWTERVKKAPPADFPRMLEEWRSLFPETEDGTEGQSEHALNWLLAQWLVRDQNGFLKAVTAEDFYSSYRAIQVIARLKPELAADLLAGKGEFKLDDSLTDTLVDELAKCRPDLYLKLNPDGMKDWTPENHRSDESWESALQTLAKTDPVAAANAWEKRKLENNPDQLLRALLPVIEAWREGYPPLRDWVTQIEDPKIRDLAQHARIMTLARKDPHAALAELYVTHFRTDNYDLRENAPSEVLAQLAKQDLPSALRLLKETSPLFGLPKSNTDSSDPVVGADPFADPPDPSPPPAPEPTPSGPPPNPFIALDRSADATPEDNWVRYTILSEAAAHLSKNPDEMFAALHRLRADMGGDSPWLREIEAELIRRASDDLPLETCLAAASLWAVERNGERDDETFQRLAARVAATNPDRAEAAIDSLPETARASFAAEIVKELPPEEIERRLALLGRLGPGQWDKELGESLGAHAADYADAIAAMPGTTTAGAREGFMKKWVEQDPEAAARWYTSLPHDEAAGPAALGLFNGWVDFDKTSAVAWAESLPAGPARQAVALDVVRAMSRRDPAEAWRWAASITDPKVRAWAYNTLSVYREDGPEAFRKEHAAVLRAAGME